MSKIFFYGLFMDRALLTEKGLHPEAVGRAVLPDYRIHIGERATLIPSAAHRAYGIVMELPDEEARALYSAPSVREYKRECVQVELLDTNEIVEASCYNLPRELGLAGCESSLCDRTITAGCGSAVRFGVRRRDRRVRRKVVGPHCPSPCRIEMTPPPNKLLESDAATAGR